MTLALGLATPSLRGHLQRDVPPSWVTRGASFDVDFVNRRVFRSNRRTVQERFDQDSLADILTLTRAAAGGRYQADGDLASMAADAFRFDHDPVTLEPLGHLFEDARTNSVRNPRAEGATVGVIGSGGALPSTGWSVLNAGGLNREVVAVITEKGIECLHLRIYGTTTGTLFVLAADTVTATSGQTYTHSAFYKRVSGSTANISDIRLSVGSTGTPFTLTDTLTRYSTTRTLAADGSYDARLALTFPSSGVAVDLTIAIGLPQLELVNAAAPFASSPIRPPVGSPAATTRAADLMTIAAGACLNPAEGTLLVILRSPYAATSTYDMRAVSISDGGTSNTVSLRARASTGQLYAVVLTSGATAFAALQGTFAANQRFKHAVAYKQNDFIAGLDGTLSSPDSSGSVPAGMNVFHVGSYVGNAKYFGHIERVSYFPFRMTNAKLAALTA